MKNQDNKVTFIRVYEDGELSRPSEFMKTCNKMNTIVQNTGGGASSINGKSESPNNTLTNTTVKLANGNMVHAQVTVIIVCRFTKCSIIIHLDQFIILHFTLPTPSHKVP